jgi:hypothetical protein
MGSIMSAIRDDIEEYEALCAKYGEKVRTKPTAQGVQLPDCYGKHAAEMKFRARVEFAMSHGKTRAQAEKENAHLLPAKKAKKKSDGTAKTSWDHILDEEE